MTDVSEGAFLKRVLLLNMAGLGDVVMMTPAVRAIRKKFPDCAIELLTINRSAALAAGVPGLDKVYSIDMEHRIPSLSGLFRMLALLMELRSRRFDLLISVPMTSTCAGAFKSRLINMIVRPVRSLGRELKGLPGVFDMVSWNALVEEKSQTRLIAEELSLAGIEAPDTEIKYPVNPGDAEFVKADLAERKFSGSPVFGMNPGAFRPSKMWPIERWVELAGRLIEKYPRAIVIVTGSASEKGLAEKIRISDRVFVSNGLYDIGRTAALYSICDVFITNDTGPMHLAAAVGARVVAIFGEGDVSRFAPSVPENRRRVIKGDSPKCERPCYKFHCPDPVCLKAVSVSDVIAKTEELLHEK